MDWHLQQHPGSHGEDATTKDLGAEGVRRVDERGHREELPELAWKKNRFETELLGRSSHLVGFNTDAS